MISTNQKRSMSQIPMAAPKLKIELTIDPALLVERDRINRAISRRREVQREYYARNQEERCQYQRSYYQRNKEKLKEEATLRWREKAARDRELMDKFNAMLSAGAVRLEPEQS